jgi:hypothetical protein
MPMELIKLPRRDGTGPSGSVRGTGFGRQSNQQSQDYCTYPKCGTRIVHTRGTPCNAINCPKCSTLMTRE